jgi:hypothetical protein
MSNEASDIAEYLVSDSKSAKVATNEIAKLRQIVENNLFLFSKVILQYEDLHDGLHGDIVLLLQDKTIEELIVLVPRGMYKSSLITIAYPIWKLCKNSNRTFMIGSYNATKAEGFLSEIKQHLQMNPLLRRMYPHLIPSQSEINSQCWYKNGLTIPLSWMTNKIIFKRTAVTKTPSVSTFGERTALASIHCHEILYDDPITEENYETVSARDKTYNKVQAIRPLLLHAPEAHSRLILVGTRYCKNDIYSRRALEKLGSSEIKTGVSGTDNFRIYCRKAIENDRAIHPSFTKIKLLSTALDVGKFIWNANYLNDPLSSKTKVFDTKDICYYEKHPEVPFETDSGTILLPRKMLNIVLHDPATGEGKCDSVILAVGITDKETIYIHKYKAGKYKPSQSIQYIADFTEEFNPDVIGVEIFGYQRTIRSGLDKEFIKRGIKRKNIINLGDTSKSKDYRIKALEPVVKQKRVFLKHEHAKLLDQFEEYPNGLIDILDVLSYILRPEIWRVPRGVYDATKRDDSPLMIINLLDAAKKARAASASGRSTNSVRRNTAFAVSIRGRTTIGGRK